MSLRLLHCADVHLGAAPPAVAAADPRVVQDLQRRAFTAACDLAIERGCAAMVIAGDLFDGAQRAHADALFVHKELTRLGRAGVRAAVLLGNHDAAAAVGRPPLPDAAFLFPSDAPAVWELPEHRLALIGQSYPTREETRDLAAGYPPPPPGWTSVGVLHTALDGRDGHAPYAPTSPDRLAALGYDYWALGHVHAHDVVRRDGSWIVYPGCLQGRSIRETGPKGCVVTTFGPGGAVEQAEFVAVDQLRWARVALDVTGMETAEDLRRGLTQRFAAAAAAADERALVTRLSLTGTGALAARLPGDPAAARAWAEAAAQEAGDGIFVEKIELTGLSAAPTTEQPDAADALAALAAIMADLCADPAVVAEAQALLTDGPPGARGGDEAAVTELLAAARAQALALAGDAA